MYELGWMQDFIDGDSIYGPSKGVPCRGEWAAGASSLGSFSVKFICPAFRGTKSAKMQTY